MNIPSQIIQGDTVVWTDAPAKDSQGNSITAPDWTLNYYFSGPTVLQVTGVAENDGWKLTLTSAQTGALTEAATGDPNYYWQATAEKAGVRVTLGTGTLRVAKNLATAVAGYDGRSQAEQDLAAVRDAIRARINGGLISEYMIGTRRLKNESMGELLALESRLKLIVSKERQAQSIANGLGDPRTTYVRFG